MRLSITLLSAFIFLLGCGGGSSSNTQEPTQTDTNSSDNQDSTLKESTNSTDTTPKSKDTNCSITLTDQDDIQAHIDSASSGAVICLAIGFYDASSLLIQDKNNLTLRGVESPDKESELNPNGAIISGKNIKSDNYYGLITIQNSTNVALSNLVIEDIQSSDGVGVLVRGSENITISNNLIQRTNSSGILLLADVDRSTSPTTILKFNSNINIYNNKIVHANLEGANSGNEALSISGTDGFEVSYNEVTHKDKNGKIDGYKEGVDIKDGSRNGSLHNNYIHDISKNCIYIDGWEHHTYNIEIYQNRIDNCGIGGVRGFGISVASERNGEVENIFIHNNYISNVHTTYYSGIAVTSGAGESGYDQNPIHNIAIINNTIHDTYSGIFISEKFQDFKSFANILVANNLIDKVNSEGGYLLGAKNIEYSTRSGGDLGSAYQNSLYSQNDFSILNNALRMYTNQGWDEYSDFRESAKDNLALTQENSLITTTQDTTLQTNMAQLKEQGYSDIYNLVESFSDEGSKTMPTSEVSNFLANFKTHFAQDYNHNPRINGTIDIGAQEE
jgi:hypothetical protein